MQLSAFYFSGLGGSRRVRWKKPTLARDASSSTSCSIGARTKDHPIASKSDSSSSPGSVISFSFSDLALPLGLRCCRSVFFFQRYAHQATHFSYRGGKLLRACFVAALTGKAHDSCG